MINPSSTMVAVFVAIVLAVAALFIYATPETVRSSA